MTQDLNVPKTQPADVPPPLPIPQSRQELIRYYRQGLEMGVAIRNRELTDNTIDAHLENKGVVDTSAAERLGKEDASTLVIPQPLPKEPLPKDAPPKDPYPKK